MSHICIYTKHIYGACLLYGLVIGHAHVYQSRVISKGLVGKRRRGGGGVFTEEELMRWLGGGEEGGEWKGEFEKRGSITTDFVSEARTMRRRAAPVRKKPAGGRNKIGNSQTEGRPGHLPTANWPTSCLSRVSLAEFIERCIN